MSHLSSRGVRLIGVGMVIVVAACGDSAGPTPVRRSPEPVALHVHPVGENGSFQIAPGETLRFEALPVGADSAVVATWRSSDTTVATVDGLGDVRSHCAGSTTVVATTLIKGQLVSGSIRFDVVSFGPTCALLQRSW